MTARLRPRLAGVVARLRPAGAAGARGMDRRSSSMETARAASTTAGSNTASSSPALRARARSHSSAVQRRAEQPLTLHGMSCRPRGVRHTRRQVQQSLRVCRTAQAVPCRQPQAGAGTDGGRADRRSNERRTHRAPSSPLILPPLPRAPLAHTPRTAQRRTPQHSTARRSAEQRSTAQRRTAQQHTTEQQLSGAAQQSAPLCCAAQRSAA